MQLFCVCPVCRTENKLQKLGNDRGEISKFHGKSFSKNCERCQNHFGYSINDIKARSYKYEGLIFVVLLLIGIIVGVSIYSLQNDKSVSYMLMLIFSSDIPSGVYFIWLRQHQQQVKRFNLYKV